MCPLSRRVLSFTSRGSNGSRAVPEPGGRYCCGCCPDEALLLFADEEVTADRPGRPAGGLAPLLPLPVPVLNGRPCPLAAVPAALPTTSIITDLFDSGDL